MLSADGGWLRKGFAAAANRHRQMDRASNVVSGESLHWFDSRALKPIKMPSATAVASALLNEWLDKTLTLM
ncbi:hypothetical protein [Methylomicrobium sp. Wu6]|uniref:hypothetical protein n=1 Tax=Methylomicrobium sp. Wu6 TaxID=3107928 RepID=UPI002DD695E2|nr:hypothetical protein [Methylomicrobium sp. Wu6]MEC4749985.1 hypothetical protein [Methylomicrobium sp. Wu6]